MSTGQKGGLALAFVALIAVVLVRPVLTADDVGGRAPAPEETTEPTPTGTPDATPTPTPTPTEPEVQARLDAPFPEECLEPQPLPAEPGLLAAFEAAAGTVTTATPGGERIASFTAQEPIGWSPSGAYLLTGDGTLNSADGTRLGQMFDADVRSWTWSPQADCAVAIDDRGRLLIAAAEGEVTTLLEGPVQSVSLSAARLAVMTRVVSAYDIRSGELVGDPVPLEAGEEERFAGWRGGSVMYAAVDGAIELHQVTPGPKETIDEVIATGLASYARPCGNRFIALTRRGEIIDVDTNEVLSGGAFSYSSPDCSVEGTYIAAGRRPAPDGSGYGNVFDPPFVMTILDGEGNYVDDASGAGPGSELFPEWAPSGSQLIFVKLIDEFTGEVWRADAQGVTTIGLDVYIAPVALDWNVTPPTGLPK